MRIYLLTSPNGSFGSAGQSWHKLDIEKIRSELNYPIIIRTILEIDDLKLDKDDIIIYNSSADHAVRTYIKDKLFFLSYTNRLIPSYELLMAHENKGFQEVMKKRKGFGNLQGSYFFDLDNRNLPFPTVLKTTQGAGSSGVFLVKNKRDLSTIKKKYFNQTFKRNVISAQRRLKLKTAEYKIYKYSKKKFNLFIEQEFIPNLKHDFKVLVFGDRYFVLKRSVKKNDFRASGSGKFNFVEPPTKVLNFAREIAEVLDNPYLSLDIALSDKGCHLIEFQATNFGPYTLLNAPNRYVYEDNSWTREKNDKDLESNYAYALNYFIDKRL